MGLKLQAAAAAGAASSTGQQQWGPAAKGCSPPASSQPLSSSSVAAAARCKGSKRRSSSPELLRCKRRLAFAAGLAAGGQAGGTAAVARRNERERNRVKLVNLGFQTLRQHVPNGAAAKKMSKVETLRSAVEYIRALQQLLAEHDATATAAVAALGPAEACASGSSVPTSPHSAYSSDESGYEGGALSPEDEQDLLEFTSWFAAY